MRRGQTTLICLLGGSLLVPTARGAADSNGNAYQTIAASNPFRLKPIPPPPSTEPEKPLPSNITLTGITTIFNDKLALMEVQQPSGKPKLFLTLSEGQRDGDVEVVSIDEKNGVVRVSNQGVPQTLDLKDANKRVASAIPAANPGPANPMAIPNAPAVPAPAAANNSVVNVGARKIPRIPRGPTADNVVVAGGGTTTGGTMTRDAQSGQQMSPVDQAVLMEVNRELTKDKLARGEMPPLPPTTPPPGPQ
ncbi:MAG TPA: hypothetical protein VF437_04270 [Verrucomicrobiae bacterium]